jgi:hypothetical protein
VPQYNLEIPIIKKPKNFSPQRAQRGYTATKEFYWDADEHGYTRIIPEEKNRNGKTVI